MKKTTRNKRSKPQALDKNPEEELINTFFKNAVYVGSSAHKNTTNPLVPNQWKIAPRPNASICPPDIRDKDTVTAWLRKAIEKKSVSAGLQRVWYIGEKGIFEGFASGNYEYHGYPIQKDELPPGVEDLWKS